MFSKLHKHDFQLISYLELPRTTQKGVYGFGGLERWNGMVEWTGLEWNGMERPDKLGSCGRVRPLPLKFGCSHPLRRDYRLLSLFAKSKDLCLQTHLIMISGTDLALSPGPFS